MRKTTKEIDDEVSALDKRWEELITELGDITIKINKLVRLRTERIKAYIAPIETPKQLNLYPKEEKCQKQ